MKRIAYIHREFRLCEWPEEPKKETFYKDKEGREDYKMAMGFYQEAIASAMENGVAFDPQEPIRNYILTNHSDWDIVFPQNGQNWPAPEEAEIEYQVLTGLNDWTSVSESYYNCIKNYPSDVKRKVAVLRSEIEVLAVEKGKDIIRNRSVNAKKSESVEKKESVMSDEIFQIIDSDFDNFPLPICFEPREEQQQLYGREQRLKRIAKSIADRLNQSTPKE